MCLTNNAPDLCFNALCPENNNLHLASLPRISAVRNSPENYRRYNCQALADISGNIKFPETTQA